MDKNKSTNLDHALLSSIAYTDLEKILIDFGEIAVDTVITDGIGREIPIISTIIGIAKTTLSIKERILLVKITKFLTVISQIPENERTEFANRIDEDSKERRNIGEKIIVLLDRLDDINKAVLIGNIFSALIKKEITYQTFIRLSSAIDKVIIEDLTQLLSYYSSDRKYSMDKLLWERLYLAGLSKISMNVRGNSEYGGLLQSDSIGPIEYYPNEESKLLGKILLRDRFVN